MLQVKATVLSDNSVYGIGGIAEHGWSVWLETPEGAFLFDTGQGKALLHNATFLGKDLATARAILISHRHVDHTGGLLDALRVMQGGRDGSGVPVHAHFDLFRDSYYFPKGRKPKHVGIPFSRASLEGTGAVFYLANDWQEIADGIYLTGEVPRRTEFERGAANLKHFDEQGELVVDPVRDDQSIVVETREGLFVILGCSHAGVINILNYTAEKTGRADFHTVMGGTHLGPAEEDVVTQTIEALLGFDIQRVGFAHCTGRKAEARVARAFGDRYFYCGVGTESTI